MEVPNQDKRTLEDLDEVLSRISKSRVERPNRFFRSVPEQINQDERAKELLNEGKAQDIVLKAKTLDILFKFLAVETFVIFFIAFLQGFKFWSFSLEEWSFRIIVTATITQITVMLIIAVKHLFPNK